MEKTRTIYRLRALRGGLLLGLLSIAWGVALFGFIRIIPSSLSYKLKETLRISSDIKEGNQEKILQLTEKAADLLNKAATEAILTGVLLMFVIFLLIRLNGNKKIKVIISWIMGLGVFIYSIGAFYRANLFLQTASLSEADSGSLVIIIPGVILIFIGLIITFIKCLKNLTEPMGVV